MRNVSDSACLMYLLDSGFNSVAACDSGVGLKAYADNMVHTLDCIASEVVFTAREHCNSAHVAVFGLYPVVGQREKIISRLFVFQHSLFGSESAVREGSVHMKVAFVAVQHRFYLSLQGFPSGPKAQARSFLRQEEPPFRRDTFC